MSKKRIGIAIALLCYSLMIAGVFFFLGYKAAYNRMEVNDINFRGNFRFSIAEGTKITWRYTDISADDLDVGDNIAITLQERSLKQIPDKYSRSRLFNYWGMKNKSQLICKNL